ncbi:MAG: DNA starvation/stationary phase protection protein [Pseudomonadota bacterium]
MNQTALAISEDARTEIAAALQQSVAETVVATMLAQNFHWNVTGMAFGPLHELFQTIYEDHFTGQDDLAERIRALDIFVDATLAGMVARSKVTEEAKVLDDQDMIKALMAAEETLGATLAGAGEIAGRHGDVLTEDLCVERGRIHEKFAWMLRAHIS